MAITLYNVTPPDNKAYIYSENKELLMTFEKGSFAQEQFIKAAQEHGDLVLTIDNYGQAVERLNTDIANKHFTQVEEITYTKYAKYAIVGIVILMVINLFRNK